jgi:hypothetical protein
MLSRLELKTVMQSAGWRVGLAGAIVCPIVEGRLPPSVCPDGRSPLAEIELMAFPAAE